MEARKLKLILCEDWFIYMYDPITNKIYSYNTETMPEWGDLPENVDQEENAVEKYMFPIVYKQNRKLSAICFIYNPETKEMICSK